MEAQELVEQAEPEDDQVVYGRNQCEVTTMHIDKVSGQVAGNNKRGTILLMSVYSLNYSLFYWRSVTTFVWAVPWIYAVLVLLGLATIIACAYASLLDPGTVQYDDGEMIDAQEFEIAISETKCRKPMKIYILDTADADVVTIGTMVKTQLGVGTRICKTCRRWKVPRCSHCTVCNKCVKRKDHHCYWLGNCIGERNYRPFMLFLVLFCFCIYIQIAGSVAILAEAWTRKYAASQGTADVSMIGCIITSTVSLLYTYPDSLLCAIFSGICCVYPTSLLYMHLKNICRGRTMIEYAKGYGTIMYSVDIEKSSISYTDVNRRNPYDAGLFRNWSAFMCECPKRLERELTPFKVVYM